MAHLRESLCEGRGMPKATRPDNGALTTLAGALLGITAMLLLRRYPGIYHDSILYLGQGMESRWPGTFGHDLFFLHGSQAKYTVMPWLLGHAFGLASPPTVFLWGTLACMLLFAAASWYCLSALLPERQRYWAWLGALCLPSIYGVVRIFSYNEPFLTSRPAAEAFSLFGIGLLVRRRWWLAAACFMAGGAFHPLQAIGALLIAWPWMVLQDRRCLHAAWLAIPLAALALAGIKPFDGMFRQADPSWFAELKYSPQLFLASWTINDIKVLGLDVLVLAIAWKRIGGKFGDWSLAALAGLALGLVGSLVLVDWLHLILPSGLQLWRVHWLAHWFSLAAIAVLLFRHLQDGERVPALLLSLTALLAWGETDWGWLLLASMYLAWPRLPMATRSRLEPLLAWVFGVAIALMLANHVAGELRWFREARYDLVEYPLDRRLLVFPLLSLGMPLLATLAWRRAGSGLRIAMFTLVLCPAAVLAALLWDSRHFVQRAVEDAAFRSDIFGVALPRNAQVYWEPEALVANWLVLFRPSFYSPGQLAGQMFFRETAEEGLRREGKVMPMLRESLVCRSEHPRYQDWSACRISDANMRLACDPSTGKGPDYLVLPFPQAQRSIGTWTIHQPRTRQPVLTYRLYRCTDVMADLRNGASRQ